MLSVAKRNNAECHYTECHFAKCHGAAILSSIKVLECKQSTRVLIVKLKTCNVYVFVSSIWYFFLTLFLIKVDGQKSKQSTDIFRL